MTTREDFEAFISAPPFEMPIERFDDRSAWPGSYTELEVDLAWQAWQAATDAATETVHAVMLDQTEHDMNLVAEKYAHKLALDLECVLADYSGTWYETAMKTLGDYRLEMNAIHERESPTFLGEPLISKDKP